MSKSKEELDRFRHDVLNDEQRQRILRDTPDKTSFMSAIMKLAQDGGYDFSFSDVEEAISAARRTWIERWLG